jgi:predicted  nucleic acid-binding Zn-ribbon protein
MALPSLPTLPFERHDEEDKKLTTELVKRLNEDTRRIRIIEQRVDRLENSLDTMQENTLTQLNDLKLDLEKINNKIVSVSEKLLSIEGEILRLSKELTRTATKRELKQMETFIDLINPITAKFATKDEVEKMIDNRVPKPKKA